MPTSDVAPKDNGKGKTKETEGTGRGLGPPGLLTELP